MVQMNKSHIAPALLALIMFVCSAYVVRAQSYQQIHGDINTARNQIRKARAISGGKFNSQLNYAEKVLNQADAYLRRNQFIFNNNFRNVNSILNQTQMKWLNPTIKQLNDIANNQYSGKLNDFSIRYDNLAAFDVLNRNWPDLKLDPKLTISDKTKAENQKELDSLLNLNAMLSTKAKYVSENRNADEYVSFGKPTQGGVVDLSDIDDPLSLKVPLLRENSSYEDSTVIKDLNSQVYKSADELKYESMSKEELLNAEKALEKSVGKMGEISADLSQQYSDQEEAITGYKNEYIKDSIKSVVDIGREVGVDQLKAAENISDKTKKVVDAVDKSASALESGYDLGTQVQKQEILEATLTTEGFLNSIADNAAVKKTMFYGNVVVTQTLGFTRLLVSDKNVQRLDKLSETHSQNTAYLNRKLQMVRNELAKRDQQAATQQSSSAASSQKTAVQQKNDIYKMLD